MPKPNQDPEDLMPWHVTLTNGEHTWAEYVHAPNEFEAGRVAAMLAVRVIDVQPTTEKPA